VIHNVVMVDKSCDSFIYLYLCSIHALRLNGMYASVSGGEWVGGVSERPAMGGCSNVVVQPLTSSTFPHTQW